MELAYQVQLVTKELLHLPAAKYQGGVASPEQIVRNAQYSCCVTCLPMPMAARSTGMVTAAARFSGIVGSDPAVGMDVCFECCVLPGRSLCVGPITRPEESYRVYIWH